MNRLTSNRLRPILLYTLLLVTAYRLAYDGDVNGNLDFFHEGDRLAHVGAILDGKLPFRDVYVQQGLGENVLKPLLACKLFGKSVEALRRLGENSYIYRGYLPPLGLLATLLAAIALVRRPIIVVAVALALLLAFYEISDRHVLGFLSVACCGAFIARRRLRWLLLAGVTASLAAIYSLEVGVYAAAAAIAWLLLDSGSRCVGVLLADRQTAQQAIQQTIQQATRPVPRQGARRVTRLAVRQAGRRLAAYGIGMAIGLAPLLVWCAANGILGDLAHNVYIQLFMRREILPTGYPTPDWQPQMPVASNLLVGAMFVAIFYGMPAVCLVALAIALCRGRPRRAALRSRVILTSLLALAFWASVVGRPDLWHVAYAVGAFFLFSAVCVESLDGLVRRPKLRIGMLGFQAAAVLSLLTLGEGGALARTFLHTESSLLPEYLRRGGKPFAEVRGPRIGCIAMEPDQAAFMQAVVSYIQQHTKPDDTILDLSNNGLLYFLCERRSPTRFHLLSHVGYSSLCREMVAEVLSHDRLPRYVIQVAGGPFPQEDLQSLLDRWYEPETRIGRLELLRCKQAAPVAATRPSGARCVAPCKQSGPIDAIRTSNVYADSRFDGWSVVAISVQAGFDPGSPD